MRRNLKLSEFCAFVCVTRTIEEILWMCACKVIFTENRKKWLLQKTVHCCPPKSANHVYPYWFHTRFMKRCWCRAFADWLKRNDMENLFLTRICVPEKLFLHIKHAVQPEKASGKLFCKQQIYFEGTIQKIDRTVLLTFGIEFGQKT